MPVPASAALEPSTSEAPSDVGLATLVLPLVALPYSWYAVMLWYSGFWEAGQTALRRRQSPALAALSLGMAGFMGTVMLQSTSVFGTMAGGWASDKAALREHFTPEQIVHLQRYPITNRQRE